MADRSSETPDYVAIAGNSIRVPAGVAYLVAKPFHVGKADTGASQIATPLRFLYEQALCG